MYMYKNYFNKTLKKCSVNPMTGYNRDGYCRPDKRDHGKHLVCAKVNKKFLDYTAKKGNNLRSVVKEGDKWCLCVDRYLQSKTAKKAPKLIKKSTHRNAKKYIELQNGGKRKKRKKRKKTKKQFLYNPDNPKKSFDVYIDKNPKDTISIKYTTVDDVKRTIKKLERLYKSGKYSHKRIWQVGMIMKVRLEAIKKHKKTKYKKAKDVTKRNNLSNLYFKFLKRRSKMEKKTRKNNKFNVNLVIS